jgi:hypothetical protein
MEGTARKVKIPSLVMGFWCKPVYHVHIGAPDSKVAGLPGHTGVVRILGVTYVAEAKWVNGRRSAWMVIRGVGRPARAGEGQRAG